MNAPARLLRLLRACLAAPGSSALPGVKVRPLGPQPPPQLLELAASDAADSTAFGPPGISDVKTKAEVPITHIVRRRISLVGSYGARASVDMPDLLEIAAKGGVDLKGAITRRFTLEEAGEAYAMLQQRKIVGRAIVCFP